MEEPSKVEGSEETKEKEYERDVSSSSGVASKPTEEERVEVIVDAGPSKRSLESEEVDCRICLLSGDRDSMVAACGCEGTLEYCHYACLEQWAKESRSLTCEICNQPYREPYHSKLSAALTKSESNQREGNDQNPEITNVELTNIQWHIGQNGAAQTKKLWCRMVLLAVFTIVVLYVILFVSEGRNFSAWMQMGLRVLSFILPFYLVGRAVVALRRYRQEREFTYY